METAVKIYSQAQVAARFNTANAKAMAARSHEKRKEKEMLREQALRQPAQGAIAEDSPRVREIESQLDSIALAIRKVKDPKEWQALATAQSKVFETWSLLTGHPRPGIRRPEKRRSSPDYAAPME